MTKIKFITMNLLNLIGATLVQIGVSDSGDEVMLSFLKEEKATALWIGNDDEGFLTIETSDTEQDSSNE